MAEKILLKVDLQCPCSYKKVKKILCKFPQIRDQVYDEKKNSVKITVVCCSPEKIRDKLCCKGGNVIKSIEIVKPPPPTPPPPPPPKPQPTPPPPPPPICCVPCYCRCGRPPPCYDINCGYWYGYGYGKECYVGRCDYFCEENTGSCNVM